MRKLLSSSMALLALSSSTIASTNCTQTFKLLRFDGSDTTSIVFQENIDGECLSLYTYTIMCSQADTVVEAVVRDALSEVDSSFLESAVELAEIDGKFSLPGGGRFATPSVDSALLSVYGEVAASHHAQVWYQYCKSNCLEDPVFEGVIAQRLYYHPRGLYINYKLRNAFYHKPTGLLLLFIDQPLLASGHDTMHGVLLYRILR